MKRRVQQVKSSRPRSKVRPARDLPKRERGRSPAARQVVTAISRLQQAQAQLESRAAELLRVANHLGDAAVKRDREALVQDLFGRQYPRDLALLLHAIAHAEEADKGNALRIAGSLGDSLLRWLEDQFGVAPQLAIDQELEVPVSRLGAWDLEEDKPTDRGQLVRVRVRLPGWTLQGRLVVRPQVQIVP
jgi:hypothetical protein